MLPATLLVLIVSIVGLQLLPFSVQSFTLQEAFQRCQDVPREEIESCVMQVVQDLKPLILDGIPELGVTTEDVDLSDINFDDTYGENYIRADFTRGKIRGLQDFDMSDIKIDYENGTVNLKLYIPEFLYTGRYILDARFFFFPLRGNGTVWFRMRNVHINGRATFSVHEMDGEPRWQQDSVALTYTYGTLGLRLNNLFDGDPVLQEAGLAFIEGSKEDIIEEMKPSIERSFAQVETDVVNPTMAKVALKDIAGHQYLIQP